MHVASARGYSGHDRASAPGQQRLTRERLRVLGLDERLDRLVMLVGLARQQKAALQSDTAPMLDWSRLQTRRGRTSYAPGFALRAAKSWSVSTLLSFRSRKVAPIARTGYRMCTKVEAEATRRCNQSSALPSGGRTLDRRSRARGRQARGHTKDPAEEAPRSLLWTRPQRSSTRSSTWTTDSVPTPACESARPNLRFVAG